jgi:uncharacterized phage protein (predicted DNA packaging)
MLSFTKQFLRIDYDTDDELLYALEEMAEDFILNTTGVSENAGDFYNIVVACLVKHFYDNRDFVVQTGAVPQLMPLHLQSLLAQLQRQKEGEDNATTQ